jgi:WD40 repeat protein
MYKHAQKGWRQFPGLTEFTDFSDTFDAKESTNITSLHGLDALDYYSGVYFSSSGTKMYYSQEGAGEIVEFSLSSPFDPSTATFVQETKGSGSSTSSKYGIQWNADGSKYFSGSGDGAGYHVGIFTVSTPYDPTTISSDTSEAFTLKTSTSVSDVAFNSDGSKLFVLDNVAGNIDAYNLATNYDVAGMSASASADAQFDYTSQIAAGVDNCLGMLFSADGLTLLLSNNAANQIEFYTLSTAFAWQPAQLCAQIQYHIGQHGCG